jgi:hypothetical protein
LQVGGRGERKIAVGLGAGHIRYEVERFRYLDDIFGNASYCISNSYNIEGPQKADLISGQSTSPGLPRS